MRKMNILPKGHKMQDVYQYYKVAKIDNKWKVFPQIATDPADEIPEGIQSETVYVRHEMYPQENHLHCWECLRESIEKRIIDRLSK